MIYQLDHRSLNSLIASLNCLGPSISAFLVESEEQDSGSPVRVASLWRRQKCPVEVLAPSIPGKWLFRRPREIEFLAAVLMMLQKFWWTRYTLGESGGNKL